MLKTKWLLCICFMLIATVAGAQSDLQVQGTTPDLYLSHTVVAKETWYSIGRLYNLSPKDIAAYNQTTMDNGLQIGQQLKIPLTKANFSQDGNRASDEVFVPLYYTVKEKEWMFRISQEHNKVPIASLESWNNIKNDDLRPGMNLVVGYLKVKSNLSALAAKGSKTIAVQTTPTVAKQEPASPTAVQQKPEEKEPVTAKATPATTPSSTPVTTTAQTTQDKPVTVQPAVRTTTTHSLEDNRDGFRGGYFKSTYKEKGISSAGNAGIFRSTSGWEDGKYYALMNDVPVGTIIKVTFPSTNKSVYAKVLGQMPEMKESIGLVLRLSDAAASELGVDRAKFYVEIKW